MVLAETKIDYNLDSDKDYLPDAWERSIGTDPSNPDSDGDLYLDGTEAAAGFSPLDPKFHQWDKLIMVNLAKQQLSYYFGGHKLEEFAISSGLSRTPTPKGEYQVLNKVPTKTYGGGSFNFYYPNTKWNLHFLTVKYGYYIHGAYWHNKFGQPMSSGCVNVSYDQMERLYKWAQVGTKIVIE